MLVIEVVTQFLAILAVIAQIALAVLLFAVLVVLVAGERALLAAVGRAIVGAELWLAFAVALLAVGGSLFFSEYAHFVPCKLCWFQRIAMYPLVPILLIGALRRERTAALYGLVLSIAGGLISTWHILVERGVIEEAQSCQISAPGGCALKWINEFGYVTIPVLALTAFALITALLLFAWLRPGEADDETE